MRRYLAIPLFLLLAGCGAQVLMQGEPNFNTAILLPYATTPERQAAAARDAARLGLTPTDLPPQCSNPNAVNGCVYAVVAIIDDLYREYRITLHHFADNGNAAADMAVLGLTTAATGPVSTVLKTGLAAGAAFISGSKSILNEDLLYKQAIEIIIHQMDADRATQLTNMINSMNGQGYTLERAKDDLLLYFAAGTWDDAITSLQTTVAANQANCKAQNDAAKVNQANQPQASGTPAPASANSSACPPAPAQPAPLTPAIAIAKQVFQAANGVGTFTVVTPTSSVSGNITVVYSPTGKNLTIPFPIFVQLVNPAPVKQ